MVNHSAGDAKDITATVTVFALDGKKTCRQKIRINSEEDTTQALLSLSKLMPKAPTAVYFLRLQLTGKQGIISENTYILSREEGNYQALTTLPKAEVTQRMTVSDDGNGYRASVTLSNKSKVPAPFVRLNLTGEDGEQILPVAYSDNYITLMPGEQKTINVTWRKEDARGQQPRIEITGIN